MKKTQKSLERFMFNPRYQEDLKQILLNRDIKGGLRAF